MIVWTSAINQLIKYLFRYSMPFKTQLMGNGCGFTISDGSPLYHPRFWAPQNFWQINTFYVKCFKYFLQKIHYLKYQIIILCLFWPHFCLEVGVFCLKSSKTYFANTHSTIHILHSSWTLGLSNYNKRENKNDSNYQLLFLKEAFYPKESIYIMLHNINSSGYWYLQ